MSSLRMGDSGERKGFVDIIGMGFCCVWKGGYELVTGELVRGSRLASLDVRGVI